ncbi:hypothetical protein C943_03161 [Mariniradius saccharolyticus AK6]|uniref:Uncharacterized protein n=1 Tax=Mariniradius saccharolyticus AK6 TaxID=1239962 RepID=M7XBQ1_9BACT|nr:hypothetical protein [Mariniradius saccharolyticus]EMS34840.1 hypothetical protein C943_03161 [Mariniradius saccharolyticus AK6]
MKPRIVSLFFIIALMSSCVDWDDQPLTGSVFFTVTNTSQNFDWAIAPVDAVSIPEPWIREGNVGTSFTVSELLGGNYVIVTSRGNRKVFQVIPGRQVEVLLD